MAKDVIVIYHGKEILKGGDRRRGRQEQHGIEADVRSRLCSRFPWFSRLELEKALKENGIRYVFLGLELVPAGTSASATSARERTRT